MDNGVTTFESSDLSLLVYRIILIICFAFLISLSSYRLFLTFTEPLSPNTGFIRFIVIFIIISSIGNSNIADILVFLQRYIQIEIILYRIISNLPCANFTVVVSRIAYLLIIISVDLNQKIEPEAKEKIYKWSKILLAIYSFTNYSSRIIVAFFNHKSWLIEGSSDETLAFLSIFYSATSVLLLSIFSFITYNYIKRTMKNSVGCKINKNLKIFSFTLIFIILCYWVATIYARFFFTGDTKAK